MKYADLITKFNNPQYISYNELLNCEEWISKSNEIKEKHNNTCSVCKYERLSSNLFSGSVKYYGIKNQPDEMLILQEEKRHIETHHTYYIKSKLPWDYEEALIPVCNICHTEIHETTKIPVYTDESRKKISDDPICDRCGGEGIIKEYNHVRGGICFKCHGAGHLIAHKINYKNAIALEATSTNLTDTSKNINDVNFNNTRTDIYNASIKFDEVSKKFDLIAEEFHTLSVAFYDKLNELKIIKKHYDKAKNDLDKLL